jgi:hypothetical protein
MEEPLADRLALLRRHIDRAMAALASDATASPVLRAVVGEFDKKLAKTTAGLPSATSAAARELIIELEQAGDSAKVAAEADAGASADAKKLVDLAHHAICVLKHELREGQT